MKIVVIRPSAGSAIVRTKSAASNALSAVPDLVAQASVSYRSASDGHESSRKLGDVTSAALVEDSSPGTPMMSSRQPSSFHLLAAVSPKRRDAAGGHEEHKLADILIDYLQVVEHQHVVGG